MKLIIAGGGTGGHLFPGIAVAEEFLSRDSSNQVLFVGSEQGIEARVIPSSGYRLELIKAAGIRGKGLLAKLKGGAMMLYGYAQSRKILKEYRPELVLGVGGYASLPMVMAANGMQIPCYIHEQNAYPGMSNRLLAKVASQLFISLEESARYFPKGKSFLTGNPLRRQILDSLNSSRQLIPEPGSDEKEGEDQFRIFIFGGSQGARTLNRKVPEGVAAIPEPERSKLQIVHQTGEAELEQVKKAYQSLGIRADLRSFIDDMAREYSKADLIICRAGATTIAELTALGKGALFIPFPFATDDHQRKNAEALLKKGACRMLLEQELTAERLAENIRELMEDRAALAEIGSRAKGEARTDAARVIVDQMLKGVS